MKKWLLCFWRALEKTIAHDGVEHAGYMSFLVLLSLFPFIVFFLALTSFIGASELGAYFVELIITNLPENATAAIKDRIYEMVTAPPSSLLTLAVIGTVWTSSSFVEGMRTILNRVYHISTPPPYLFRRLLSILQFLIINIFISFAMFLLVIIPVGLSKIPELQNILNSYVAFWGYFRYLLIWGSLFLTTTAFYFILPNKKITFKEVIPGGILTVILWGISGYLLSNYLVYYRQFNFIYGSLGSIIITMLFFYIVSMLFIYGAEFNYQIKQMKSE